MGPSVSVILATYRQPAWLEKVLLGYSVQTHREFELLVADDGSDSATAAVVERLRSETGLRLRHLWQEDRGFRKSRALNRAIVASRGDYLIFSDGDCIPRDDFVETHRRLAEPGRYLSGGALRLPRPTSQRIRPEDVLSGRATRLGWLVRHGWRPGHRVLRLTRRRRLAAALDALTPTGVGWNGGNASAWREDVFAVNGFDEEMGYKGQDRGFGDRLVHLGLRGKQVRHRAVLVHLDHDRPYKTRASIERNRRIRARIRAGGETRARRGIEELEEDGEFAELLPGGARGTSAPGRTLEPVDADPGRASADA